MSNRSSGFQPPMQQQPEYQVIKLHKSNNGMGLSIVAAKVGPKGSLQAHCVQRGRLLFVSVCSPAFPPFRLSV